MAALLNKPEAADLQAWAGEVRSAFNEEFFDAETKVYSTGSQTAMAMPYCTGLIDERYREKVFANLVDSIVAGNKGLTAGDVGFHFLVEALTEGDAAQLMFEMIHRDDVLGYGFQLKKGATALTESWAALEIVSNNHLMLGHVMEWFYAGLGGIGQAENSSGYREITIQPQLAGDLNFAKTSFRSPYGWIRSDWERKGNAFHIEVEIPPNTSADVFIPAQNVKTVRMDGSTAQKYISEEGNEQGKVKLRLGSGIYRIQSEL